MEGTEYDFAISGVDIALWDIAKCANLPLYKLWGGSDADKVPAYASLVKYSDQGDLKSAALHAQKAGYNVIKLHQVDDESLKTVRNAVGEGARLTIDINCAWSPDKALERFGNLLHTIYTGLKNRLSTEDFKSLARLGQLSGIPIASGENACTVFQFQEMLEAGAATFIQPSLIKVGGISEWRKVAILAEVYNIKVKPHSPYFGPGLLATAHLVATHRNAEFVEYLYVNLETSVFKTPPHFERGYLHLPQGPGLGLEIDPAVLKQYKQV